MSSEVPVKPFAFALIALLCACGSGGGESDGGVDAADAADAADNGNGTCQIPEEPNGQADCGFESIPFDHLKGTVLQLQSADGEICARLLRRDDSPFPDGSATLWTLLEFKIGPVGSVASVDDPDSLCWKVSHHNWTDAARAWTGTSRYDLELNIIGGHAGDSTYILNVLETGPLDPGDTYCLKEGSTPRCPPVELYPFEP